MNIFMAKRSLRNRLISIFFLTSTIPLLCVGIFLSYNTVRMMRENTRTLTQQNLKQIDDNMNLLLDSYKDLVYQIYTDDDVVKWMESLNAGEDEAVTINQLRRYMNALLYSKDDIGAITVISDSGRMVTTHTFISFPRNMLLTLREKTTICFTSRTGSLITVISTDNAGS